jgi:hypothetical protein
MPSDQVRDLILRGALGELALSRARRQLDVRARTHADPARMLLTQLAELGAVEQSPAGEGRIRLTSLAQCALAAELAAVGVDVPVIPADPARMSAAGLVALHGGVLPAEHEQLAAHWVAARSPRTAAAELLDFAAGADAAARLVAIGIVREMGDSGMGGDTVWEGTGPAWRDALRYPEVRPYARIELSRHASAVSGSTVPLVLEPSPDDLTWLATDLLALACGDDDPDPELIAAQFREAVRAGQEAWLFGLMSMSSHPDVVQVLTILSRHHPDRRVARDARRAAHRATVHRAARASSVRHAVRTALD